MKKIILATLSVLSLVSYGQLEKKSEKKNDLTEENLKGKVKSIKETTYKAVDKFGQIEKGDVLNNYFNIYNEKGNKIEDNFYDSDGNLSSKDTYEYDEKGNKIEKNVYDSNGRFHSKYTYKYDEKGNMIEDNVYDSNGRLYFKKTYKYDEKGNKIEENWYNSDGRLHSKYTYKYDEKGNNIEENYYNSNGRLYEKHTYKYEYDKNNNWTQRIEYKNTIPHRITEKIIEYYP